MGEKRQRKSYTNQLKARVALEAIKGQRTINEIASDYELHPNLVNQWKRLAVVKLQEAFSSRHDREAEKEEELRDRLYREIGQLKVELDWLKKNLDCTTEQKRAMIDPGNKEISIERQCGLVGLSQAGYYYEPKEESPENLAIMRWIDEKYTDHPFYGVLRMTEWLRRDKKYAVNPKRVRRLMKLMGLYAIYPKPRLSEPGQGHKVYPYLLRNVTVTHPNHVWSVDITYIRLRGGFIYLVAIIDWFSRFVVSWEISNSLESDFCISALNRALSKAKPEIFNSDQGVQFTSQAFTSVLKEHQISISMDGRGRALDNVFVERLWRSVKYEEVYLNDYESTEQAVSRLRRYFQFYNHERRHQLLGYETPVAVYQSTREIASAAQPINGLRPPAAVPSVPLTACSLRLSGG